MRLFRRSRNANNDTNDNVSLSNSNNHDQQQETITNTTDNIDNTPSSNDQNLHHHNHSESESNGVAFTSTSPSSRSTSRNRIRLNNGPGAFSVSGNGDASSSVYRVQIPPNIRPGEEFSVNTGTRIVRVICPPNVNPGQHLHITVPARPRRGGVENNNINDIPNNALNSANQNNSPNVRRVEDNESLRRPGQPPAYTVEIPQGVRGGQQFGVTIEGQQLNVTCPPNALPGMLVRIIPPTPQPNHTHNHNNNNININNNNININNNNNINNLNPNNGHNLNHNSNNVNVANNESENVSENIISHATDITSPPPQRSRSNQARINNSGRNQDMETNTYEVLVPHGVQSGQPFALMASGVRVLVTCPTNAQPGSRIRFHLPSALLRDSRHTQHDQQRRRSQRSSSTNNNNNNNNHDEQHQSNSDDPNLPSSSDIPNSFINSENSKSISPLNENDPSKIRLSYDSDGWTRIIRVSDMKFQWVRMDDKGDLEFNKRFDMTKSAYVRKLDMVDGRDPRMRGGFLSFVPATDATIDSKVKGPDGVDIVTYSDIASVQTKPFEEKTKWFYKTCSDLCVEWNMGHMRLNVRREFLLGDSMEAVMSLSRKDLRKVWRFEFIGEQGIDAGGLAREWFHLCTKEIFDPARGLWQSSSDNQMCMQINPASFISCPEHLHYFRFLGRVMGKALFDRQLIAAHMVQYLYKHILGWPITFSDLESLDEEYFTQLKKTALYDDEEMALLCLDFTQQEETMGVKTQIELIPDGASTDLTTENLPEYLEACLKYRMIGRVKPQLKEILLGFFDVIPEPLLTIFDFQELELLMCGLPKIDMNDWMDNTNYTGIYEYSRGENVVCCWFWEVVEEMNQEMRARLLQFVTGTSGVPIGGFGILQGNDGTIRKFTIHGVETNACLYPRAHTCFNRIDLPTYDNKIEMQERLLLAVTMSATGFDLE